MCRRDLNVGILGTAETGPYSERGDEVGWQLRGRVVVSAVEKAALTQPNLGGWIGVGDRRDVEHERFLQIGLHAVGVQIFLALALGDVEVGPGRGPIAGEDVPV